MRTSTHNIKLALLSFLFFTMTISHGQVKLETIYLNANNSEELVYTNNFSTLNNELIAEDVLNFRMKIKSAKQDNDYLIFLSDNSALEVLTANYLKTIRKGANRSSNAKAFEAFLRDRLPELILQFTKDNNLEDLYAISRKNTFNGKIDALPSVL